MMKSGMLQSCCQPSQIQWIADSEATHNMTPSRGHFQIYPTLSELHKVTTTRGGILRVVEIGDLTLDKLWTIKKELHMSNLKMHLISLQKLVDETGWHFIIDSDDCSL